MPALEIPETLQSRNQFSTTFFSLHLRCFHGGESFKNDQSWSFCSYQVC